MDNKFKPISRPTYGGSQNNGAAPYNRPVYGNKPQSAPIQQPNPQPEYQQPSESSYQEEYAVPTPGYMPVKEKGNKKLILGIIGAVVVLAVVIALFTFGGKGGDVEKVDNVLNGDTVGTTTSLLGNTNTTNFNGSAVEVPWPSDITPTKMEINLDPTTGEPVLMLVGEKSGVGTVIRSYNKAGALTGFWVIVSSDPALSGTQAQTGGSTVTGTTPTLEQTIADEVHVYLGGKITGMSTEDIIKEFNESLTATATKYGKTVEDVLGYYFTATGLTPAN